METIWGIFVRPREKDSGGAVLWGFLGQPYWMNGSLQCLSILGPKLTLPVRRPSSCAGREQGWAPEFIWDSEC